MYFAGYSNNNTVYRHQRKYITAKVIEINILVPGQYYDQETGLHQNYFDVDRVERACGVDAWVRQRGERRLDDGRHIVRGAVSVLVDDVRLRRQPAGQRRRLDPSPL